MSDQNHSRSNKLGSQRNFCAILSQYLFSISCCTNRLEYTGTHLPM